MVEILWVYVNFLKNVLIHGAEMEILAWKE